MKEDEKDFLEESFRKEVLKAMDDKLSEKQKKELMEEAETTLKFLDKIEEVELPSDNYVIFTDGKEQLFYENGEFYIISTTDSLRQRKKKTKKEATDLYLDFFIKYQLNPILDRKAALKERNEKSKDIVKAVPHKEEVKVEEKQVKEVEKKNIIEKDEPSL